MNKIIAVLVSLALVASPALATFTPSSTASSQLSLSTSGVTTVATLSQVAGWNGGLRASVAENVYNKGVLNLDTSVDFKVPSFGASEMLESKTLAASGNTKIIKGVAWWSPGPANTANLYIGWMTNSASDEVDVTNVGEGSVLYNMQTNSLVNYKESFGLNKQTDCTPKPPMPPVPPTCLGCPII